MMNSNWCPNLFLVFVLIVCTGIDASAEELRESFLASGVTRKIGGYRPHPAEMDQEADIVKVAPDDLQSPHYGLIEVGAQRWAFILDEPEPDLEEAKDEEKEENKEEEKEPVKEPAKEAQLYLDTNGDGDLTNDPEINWQASQRGEYKQYSGNGTIDLGGGKLGAINFYRFDPKDKRRAALKNTLMFYTDYGFEYSFALDGKEFSTFISGGPSESTRFLIDRDGNGKMSRRFEQAKVGEPFNFTGTTYVFDARDGVLSLEQAAEEVEQMPLPPNLEVGEKALLFTAKTMDDTEVVFPKDYANKIVLLDFWATWCGPCIGEIPNMKQAYTDWHEKGFEILGISFDREDMAEKISDFLEKNEMPWPQIYEGKTWESTLGIMHDVSGIPFVLLVDGDSGEILATARQLRGKGLSAFVRGQLEKKLGVKFEDPPVEEKESESDTEPKNLD